MFRSDLKMSNAYRESIKGAYNYRNKIHDEFEDIEKHEFHDALQLHEKLFYIARKFYRDYNENYDEYKGVPDYKPLEIDFTDDEVEQIKIPDFNRIVDIQYDYCVICSEPNHLNYSIYCHKCSRIIDNANNFISLRNAFGRDAKFTKDDLIEYGMPEGYVNQFVNSLVREDMLRVKGRFITFNNMHLDEYLRKIDNYIAVGELITKFRENKITPSEIKMSREYKLGSMHQEPFYQFFKIINREILTKFEKDILTTEDIWQSIEYTTITGKELARWYKIQHANYNKNIISGSFEMFNRLLQNEYLELKRQGHFEKDIKKQLNVTDEIYEFWIRQNPEFISEIRQINKDLLLKALSEGKTRSEAIEIAGVTAKEYEDLVKYSDFKGDEFSQMRNREVETRKRNLIEYLKHNDLNTACELAKISVNDFYGWYEKDMASEFYMESTRVLMHNFLNQRRKGKTKLQSAEAIGLDYRYVEHWFKRTLEICEKFKNDHVKVIADLILDGFKNKKTKLEISKTADVNVNRINSYLNLGKRGNGTYKLMYDYYEEHILPRELSRFLTEIKNKPVKKALEISELTEHELDECCKLAEKGIKYTDFYTEYQNIKTAKYITSIIRGKDKSKALRNAGLTADELDDDIEERILKRRIEIVSGEIIRNKNTKQAAKKANVSPQTVYDWYLKGKEGDAKFTEFSELYYEHYIEIGSEFVQKALEKGISPKYIIKNNRNLFTKEDYEFWKKNGFINEDCKRNYDLNEDDDE